jgi:hypothetical protein
MLKATVNQAATAFRVTEKTIRKWMDEGMPVIQAGSVGRGRESVIDMARAISWVARKRRVTLPAFQLGDGAAPANPLRWLLEIYADGAMSMVKTALMSWYGDKRWQPCGMTDAQARATVWELFALIALLSTEYRVHHFEKRSLAPTAGGADLDDLASLWFQGDIRSRWDERIEIPQEIEAFKPTQG